MSDPMIRVCSLCGKAYGPEYRDTFCLCGFELIPSSGPVVSAEPLQSESPPPAVVRPAVGTRCLVLYGPDKQPLHYFPLTKDITSIGRQDPVEAGFPDIDLTEWLDASAARRVSRQHVLVLHSRLNDSYTLRALPGNTGTQLEADMLPAQRDVPLKLGHRIILGGVVRLKLEVT